jgi:hypothetical protein
MDGNQDKKWFIYIGDHHEGPFAPDELRERFAQGQITPESFAWCDGMGDWKQAGEIPDLSSVFQASEVGTSTRIAGAEGTIMAQAPSFGTAAPVTSISAAKPAPQPQAAKSASTKPSASKPKVSKALIVLIVFLLVGGGVGVGVLQGFFDPYLQGPGAQALTKSVRDAVGPVLVGVVDRFPGLAKVFSPISKPEGVQEAEWLDLQGAAIGAPAAVGPKVGITAGDLDPTATTFYVASNLPDGASFEIQVDGVADTLLNHLAFSARTRALINARFATTPAVRGADGKPLPRGEYVITLFEGDQQPEGVKSLLASMPASSTKVETEAAKGRKIVTKKVFFLGGKKDGGYQVKLKEFHEKIKEKSKKELDELKQFAGTVETELNGSVELTQRIKGPKLSKGAIKSWSDFHTKWSKLDAELVATFQKWSPELLSQEFFYGPVYALLLQTHQAVQRAHGVHDAFFTSKAPDLKSFEIQLGEANSAAQSAISMLKTKIDQAEKLPPTPAGLPRRDGL